MSAALAVAFTGSGRAQSVYPDRPIKVILPYTAGSPNDTIARAVAPIVSLRLKQPLVLDNRPGAGTLVGVKAVMSSPPDGYTLLFTNTPTHVIAQFRAQGLAYDPIGDFVPIVAVGRPRSCWWSRRERRQIRCRTSSPMPKPTRAS